jgi:condensation enzyme
VSDRYPLSPAQELWSADDAAFAPGFVMADALRVAGAVDTRALQDALDDVVDRHPILRTTVVRDTPRPHQRVAPPCPVPLEVRTLPDGDRDRIASELLTEAESAEVPVHRLPLLRAVLARFDDADAVLTLVTHHTAGDGWSMDLLKRDLAACYAARVTGGPAHLPDARPYGEYAARRRDRPDAGRALAYWREKLGDARRFALPADRPVTSCARPYRSQNFLLDADLMDAIGAMATSARASVFVVLLAAFNVLAHGITGTTDPAVNAMTAGRGERRFHDTVGSFLNFLTLRTDLASCGTFRDIVLTTRRTLLEAHTHELPIQDVERALPDLRNALENPRNCDFIFGYTRPRFDLDDLALARGARPVRRLEQASTQMPGGAAWTMATEPSGQTFGKVQYNPDEFDAATVAGWTSAYVLLLARLTEDPERDWRTTNESRE